MAIKGVTYRVEGNHNHVNGTIKYDASPPIGGNHDQFWANCNGVVYDHQIANENAVHMLEHGAVWITYNPATLPASDLPKLKSYVTGQSRVAMTPYAGLKTPISLLTKNENAYFLKGSLMMQQSKQGKDGKLEAPDGTAEALNKYLELEPDGPHANDAKQMLQFIGAKIQTTYKAGKKK